MTMFGGYRGILLSCTFVLMLFTCTSCESKEGLDAQSQYEKIKERGKIVAVTDYNSINYFIYRGTPMGYQYELLKRMAEDLELDLEIKVSNNIEESFRYLYEGETDLVALNLTVTKERKNEVNFTKPHNQTRQMLVQRKPAGWELMSKQEKEEHMIRNQLDLAGKTVYVRKNSAFIPRLENLMEEIGDTIYIIEKPMGVEKLISKVSEGEIDYTVADENMANVNETYYSNIDVSTPLSFPQNQSWAVRKGNDSLLKEVNRWLGEFKETLDYRHLYAKYFNNPYSARRVQSDYFALSSGRLSPYDEIIKEYSEEIGWDWLLLASMIYQESSFRADVQSWAGAQGLMQLMPATAKRFGVGYVNDPVENIRAGVRYIKWLEDVLENNMEDREERLKFILASYNAGLGHVFDARALARKYGRNPDRWDGNVDYFLLNKSDPVYYQDSVVAHGYCRGEEPYRYVTEILDRYDHYKNIMN